MSANHPPPPRSKSHSSTSFLLCIMLSKIIMIFLNFYPDSVISHEGDLTLYISLILTKPNFHINIDIWNNTVQKLTPRQQNIFQYPGRRILT